jgi:uncharacterized membrane protein
LALRDIVAALPDRVTGIIGSWRFVLGEIGLLIIWAAVNVIMVEGHKWDPYPFVLLNLVFGLQAALIGPIIMMSQARQEARDKRIASLELQLTRDFETLTTRLLDKLEGNEVKQSMMVGRMEALLVELELRQRAMEESDER